MFERVREFLSIQHLMPIRGRMHELKFRPELISELRFAHRMLEQQLREVRDLHRRSFPAAWLASLGRLDRALRAYFAKEGPQLEPYLSLTLPPKGEVMQTLRDIRSMLRSRAQAIHEIVELSELHQLERQRYEEFGRRLEWLDTSIRMGFSVLERQVFPHYLEVRRGVQFHPRAA